MNNEYIKLVEASVEEDVKKGVNIAVNDKNLKLAKDEILKDIDIDQINTAFAYIQKIKQMAEEGKIKDKDFAKKLVDILSNFYNDNYAEVGETGSHSTVHQDKINKGLIGAKLKT
jgi:hypothetical protein